MSKNQVYFDESAREVVKEVYDIGGGDDPQLVESLKDFAIADLGLNEEYDFIEVIKSGKTTEDVLQQYLDARIYYANDTAAQVIKLDSVSNMLEEYTEYSHLVEIEGQYKVDLDKLKALILKTCGGDIPFPTKQAFVGFSATNGWDETLISIVNDGWGKIEVSLFNETQKITSDASTVISALEDEQVIQFFTENIIPSIYLKNVQVVYDAPYKFTAIKIDDFLDIFVEVKEPKTLGQDLKDYVESLTNPAIYLSPEFEGFLQDNGVDTNKVFVLGDISEGLNGAFSIEAGSSQNLTCRVMGGYTGITYGEGSSQYGGVETLNGLLSVDGGIWDCFTNSIQWKDLDKTINLSITIGGTNYEIKDISLDEIKTFIKEKQVVEEGGGGIQK